ncbi:energy transducer TonB, partial [Lysobacter sp. D1-1-M9]
MTVQNPQARRSRRLSTVSKMSLLLALGLALAACSDDSAAPDAAVAPATSGAPAATAAPAAPARTAAMSVEELREAARTAYSENRLYAPADDNAVEYYLALREKAPADAGVSSALTDLLPMTVIATEQSVQREDFDEARRLAGLLQRMAPQHPALVRLQASIETRSVAVAERAEQEAASAEQQAERQAELERERLAQQQQQQREAARELAAQEARDAAEQEAADQLAAEQQAAAEAAEAT